MANNPLLTPEYVVLEHLRLEAWLRLTDQSRWLWQGWSGQLEVSRRFFSRISTIPPTCRPSSTH